MHKFILLIVYVCIFLLAPVSVFASSGSSFVNIVNPVRGEDFWDAKQSPAEAVKGELAILQESNTPATWLVRFDALNNQSVVTTLSNMPPNQEKGLFLEVIPSWTTAAGVNYQTSAAWHFAGSVFLTGYSTSDREKLIDTAFNKFKQTFGFFPKSVGAWWVDSYSLAYMQKKYGITSSLIVADQYTTDNYQIWGQYWSTPYYPAKNNALLPAGSVENKLPVVLMQWAARDPVNGYGGGVKESTYSVQANDYIDYHDLNTSYFSKLIDLYTQQQFNQFNQVVVGLENSYDWSKYKEEYRNQIKTLVDKRLSNQITLATMSEFADWYQASFKGISPEHIIVAKDPLGADKMTVWYMNPYYRAGWFYNQDGSLFRDIRQYLDGQIEPCYSVSCSQLNFATFSTRVLDEITYKQSLSLDQGKITNIKLQKEGLSYILTYLNEAGRKKQIEFLPRDISIDGKVDTIDSLILQSTNNKDKLPQILNTNDQAGLARFRQSTIDTIANIFKFLLFSVLVLIIPGFVLVKFLKQQSFTLNIFLSICLGIVNLVLVSYISGYLKFPWLVLGYVFFCNGYFYFRRLYHEMDLAQIKTFSTKSSLLAFLLIFIGTIFQSLALIRSGWAYNFGIGFWGPLGHDGIWHQALINQLIKNSPPFNPALAGEKLANYHYFYDLLLATTFKLSQIPVLDLLYRFYPILISILVGWGTYILVNKFFRSYLAALLSLYFVYFAGSFGWIVEFIRERHFGGESAFWVNQPVSMNLNPPFAISLLIVIAIILVLKVTAQQKNLIAVLVLALMTGALIEFKVYAGVISLAGLLAVSLWFAVKKKDIFYLKSLLISTAVALGVFLPQNSSAGDLLVLSPFWFVHSMIDFPDRVGWLRLSQAREAYFARGEWLKFIGAEGLALLLFIIGNIGTRFVAFAFFKNFFKEKLWEKPEYQFIIIAAATSLFIPILFIQKGNPWNTIQFFYYFLYFMSLFAGIVIISLGNKIKLIKNHLFRFISFCVVGFLLIVTPINAVVTFRSALYPNPPSRLSFGELDALEFLKKLPDGVVLTYPFNKELRARAQDPYPLLVYDTTSYVSAFSGKQSFLEDEIQQEILQNNYKKRLVASNEFLNGRDLEWSKSFLTQNNIRYIYIPKIYKEMFDANKLSLKTIFENGDAKILEVTQ